MPKYLYNSLVDLVIFSTKKIIDVSSANSFALDAKPSDKLFMYIRKKNNPSIEPCGTPASIESHGEYCPFRITLFFR